MLPPEIRRRLGLDPEGQTKPLRHRPEDVEPNPDATTPGPASDARDDYDDNDDDAPTFLEGTIDKEKLKALIQSHQAFKKFAAMVDSGPPTTIWETGDALHIEVEAPGARQDDFTIGVFQEMLVINLERPQPEDFQPLYDTRRYGTFQRIIPLPQSVLERGQVQLRLENGILSVKLPKARVDQPENYGPLNN